MGVNAQTSVPAFTAGQVLTAAEMTQVNTGIPVFATTVTRDAAFGGASEKVLAQGQTCYIEATSSYQSYTGSTWITLGVAPGLVSIIPTSVAVGSGSATTSAVGQVTCTGASSVSLNGVFSAAYNNYFISLNVLPASGTPLPTFRVRSAGTDLTTSTYTYSGGFSNSTTLAWLFGSNSATSIFLPQLKTTAGMISININSPFLAANTVLTTNAFGNDHQFTAGSVTNTTSYDGFTITTPSSTLAGTISVYGYNQ